MNDQDKNQNTDKPETDETPVEETATNGDPDITVEKESTDLTENTATDDQAVDDSTAVTVEETEAEQADEENSSGDKAVAETNEDSDEESAETPISEDEPTQTDETSDETSTEPEDTDPTVENTSSDETSTEQPADEESAASTEDTATDDVQPSIPDEPQKGRWYVVHTYSGHENKVSNALKQKIASEHLENKIFDILVPTQDKIEIRGGKKEQVKEKIFPGYILVKMDLDDISWLAVRTTPGVTAFVGIGNKPTPISEAEVKSIVQYMNQGAPATFKEVFLVNDTVKIIDGPFADFIGKIDSVDKEKGKVRVLVSIFGRETPVELDFLQVQKL